MKFRLTRHVAFQVNDHKKAAEFYKNIMGMELKKEKDGETELRCGDTTFFVEESPNRGTFFDFEVDDIEAAKQSLLEAGCKITKEYSSKNFMISDPYGMSFHLFEKGSTPAEC